MHLPAGPSEQRRPSVLTTCLKLGKKYLNKLKLWQTVFILTVAIFFLLPIVTIVKLALFSEVVNNYKEFAIDNIWKHLLATTLPNYIKNSFVLIFLTGTYTFIIGVATAWIVSHYHFYTRKIVTWALILPFSIPAYISAYIYADFLDYSGPLQIWIRTILQVERASEYYFPSIRSLGGASVIMTLALYPYVYLLARKAFHEHSASLARAQELMGISGLRGFFKISLPLARPAISVGVILVVLETLNDFGAVEYLAVHTISIGVYNLWLNLNDLTSATRLACLTLIVVCSIIYLEHLSRRAQEQYQKEASYYEPPRNHPSRFIKVMLAFFCWIPIILGFIIPVSILVVYTIANYASFFENNFIKYISNTLALSLWAAGFSTLIAVTLAYLERNQKSRFISSVSQFVNLGYAIPGTIVAIGIIIPFGVFDNWFDAKMELFFGLRPGLVLSGTGGAIIFAYIVRFSSISLGSTRSSLKKISMSIDQSGKLFGYNDRQIITRIHLPLLKKSILTGFLIIFIDSMKELSATIILRPFDFETLATYIYAFASDELIEEAAAACLLLILVGLIPIYLITQTFIQENHKSMH